MKQTSWLLPDDLWNEIASQLPATEKKTNRMPSSRGRKPKPAREVFEAVAHVLRTGISWRALPRRYGSSSAIHARYMEWRNNGFFDRLIASNVLKGTPLEGLPWPATDADISPPEISDRQAQSRRERVRDKILDAATIVFEENGGENGGGFERTTVEAISQKAHVSTRTFFRYFNTKSEAIYIDWRYFLEWYESAISERAGTDDLLVICLETFAEEFATFTASKTNRDRIRRAYLSPNFASQRQSYLVEIRDMILRVGKGKKPEQAIESINELVVAAIVPAIIDTVNVRFCQRTGSMSYDEFKSIAVDILKAINHIGDKALLQFFVPEGIV